MENSVAQEQVEETKEILTDNKLEEKNAKNEDGMEMKPTPKPTLYVRGLNDKIKSAGKSTSDLLTGYLEMRI